MESKQIIINTIGIIHTPFNSIKGMPIQPFAAEGVKGHIELFPEYTQGLTDLEGFSHITLVYHLHKINGYDLMVKPFMDNKEHGIFATKSPKRPNAIGISTVKILEIKHNVIHIEMVDMLNGTPLIDIKPFFSKFDNRTDTKSGWLDNQGDIPITKLRSDERFKL
ncbi:tRNA (N6-threonylcarbamoyladenosine(37)-N6)-methyltransferase TrmO [Yeosuana marina]|uniref:tRNA (N6-threonylcarbamoyladenosine(37)-N6)-methyltransferase TrmO n=1 Tax=Yeosuana marina TaxID=1565536 RepID=UPI0030C8AA84|tara:strand:+ start:837 stop:1331 length:495 start_codon:yes stop_codon:yes gene_type:complete